MDNIVFTLFLWINETLKKKPSLCQITRPSRPTMRPLWINVFYEWMFFMNECCFMNECHLWMNKWFIEWISRCMLLLLCRDHFSIEKMHEFDVFDECVTWPTDRPTNQPTDMTSYRSARTHLKRKKKEERRKKERNIWRETEREIQRIKNLGED